MKRIIQYLGSTWAHVVLLIGLSIIAFFPSLGSIHLFDWDEINFAEAAREMLVTGNYSQVQINFEPFYEKPPLFFWLQALSMRLWGINEFAARFPNALFGIFTLITLYLIGKREVNSRFGLLWALMHFSALLSHFYFKTGIIDPVFNYFIFLGIYSLVRLLGRSYSSLAWAWIGGGALGLAILTKGPVGFLIPCLTGIVYSMWNIPFLYRLRAACRRRASKFSASRPDSYINMIDGEEVGSSYSPSNITARLMPLKDSWHSLHITVLIIISWAIPSLWLGYETYQQGAAFARNFIIYQRELFNQPIAGHGQPFYYHFLVVFWGCFPASVLALGSLFKPDVPGTNKMLLMIKLLFWVVMILFSLSTTKIVHYSSMAYFPISFLAAYYLFQIDQGGVLPSKAIRSWLWIVGSLVGIIFTALPFIALHRSNLYRFIADPAIIASLKIDVPWGMKDCMVGISYLLCNLVAFYFFYKRAVFRFVTCFALATTCCLVIGTFQIIPKIEAHTQRPVIEFYKRLAGQSAYVTTVGFKSYAPLFYFQQPPHLAFRATGLPQLLSEKIDCPAYFVLKVNDMAQLSTYPTIKLLYIEGGFAFLKRDTTS